jgi:hypothetical protein
MNHGGLQPAWPEWGFWLLLGALVGRYVLAGFEMQSHDILVILLTALCVQAWCENQDGRAGALAGLAAACKATPLLFAPVFLWQRRYRALACLLLVLVGATLLPDLISPANSRVPWVVTWYHTFLCNIQPGSTAQAPGGWPLWNELNQALAGTVYRLCASPGLGSTPNIPDIHLWDASPTMLKALSVTLQLGVLALLGVALWPRREQLSPEEQRFIRFGQGGVVTCAMLLLSPMSSKAHFAVLVLPMSVCVADFVYRRRDPVVGVGFALVFVMSSLTVKGVWGSELGNMFLSYGSVCWSTLLCMLLTVRVIRSCQLPCKTSVEPASQSPRLAPPRPRFLRGTPARERDD